MASIPLTAFADPAMLNIASVFASLGVLTHLSLIPFEIDGSGPSLVAGFALSWLGLVTVFIRVFEMDILVATTKASLAGGSFLGALFTSMVIYRMFFHRLHHFPGPFTAKISRFLVASETMRTGMKYHLELDAMHEKYGDFVRVGPREISINRASAVHLLHGPKSPCQKGTWYSITTGDQRKCSLGTIRDHEIHRLRRKAWDKGLGIKALAEYAPRVESKADILMKRLGERAGEIVDMTKWSLFYTFDVMGLVTFSKDYKQLDDAEEHFTIAAMHSQMEIVGIFGAIPWIVPILTSIPGLKGPLEVFVRYSNAQIDERKAEWNQDPNPGKRPRDVTSWLIKAMQDGDPSAPSTIEAFHDDGRLAIIAGSDTTGSTLANIFYFLAKHPKVYEGLQKEVDDVKSSGGDTSQIPYLDAIITEALRLRPVLPSGLKRNTPPEGLLVDEVWIPGNTIVFAAQHVIQRDERNFEKALEFLPERWLDEGKHLHKNEQAWFPFSIGHYSCVGRPLALMQIRTVLHRVASEFDLSFAPGDDGRNFWEETKDTFTLMCPALPVVLTKRDGALGQPQV